MKLLTNTPLTDIKPSQEDKPEHNDEEKKQKSKKKNYFNWNVSSHTLLLQISYAGNFHIGGKQ